jgi:arylsulfatase A-like enzyme
MKKPNIVYILADDMGYGDLGCNNPDSRIPTPNLDRMAKDGMRFTDAHAGSSVCTPSRYNILTGQYCWRSRLKQGIVWQWDAALIEPDQKTVGHLLREEGYTTACVGKWHLGWDWATKNGTPPNDTVEFGRWDDASREELSDQIDFESRIGGGPVDRGFDTYFGVDVPNFPPYAWFENDRLTEVPTDPMPDDMYGHPGVAVPGWDLKAVVPELTRRAAHIIESNADSEQPFFLYYPLTSPHSPIVPNDEFVGKSGAGNYGDFVCEVDWIVGEICDALERTGQADNTLIIFTSDNGPEGYTPDDSGAYERAREHRHYSMGELRGLKRDAWEGGHRVPFIARWPGVTPANTVCDQLITLGDLMATCAEMTGAELRSGEAEDSVSMLPLLHGNTDSPVRSYAVHHSLSSRFAVRKDDWVLIDNPCGGEIEEPEWFRQERGYEAHDFPAELFNLQADLGERKNCYGEQAEIVAELSVILREVKSIGHSDAAPQGNERFLTE